MHMLFNLYTVINRTSKGMSCFWSTDIILVITGGRERTSLNQKHSLEERQHTPQFKKKKLKPNPNVLLPLHYKNCLCLAKLSWHICQNCLIWHICQICFIWQSNMACLWVFSFQVRLQNYQRIGSLCLTITIRHCVWRLYSKPEQVTS